MEFTGERYVPSLNGIIKYEHLHRYAACLQFVTGKNVLDIASGEGYGSALLAKVAESVVGVDIDNESVEYASSQYSNHSNLKFLVGSCEFIPLTNNSVDIVTSFETIEHHDRHEEMMQEIKRVLKPGGLLILSSPNRLVYSDEPNNSNSFHIKELYHDELVDLLNRHFNYSKIYGQKLAIGSFLYPLDDANEISLKAYTGNLDNLTQQVCSLKSPLYFVAICSDEADKINTAIDSLYIDPLDDLLKVYELNWHQSQSALQHLQSEFQQTQAELERSHLQLQQLQTKSQGTNSQLQQTQTEFKETYSQLDQQQNVEELQLQLQEKQAELERSQQRILSMESSKLWKLRVVWLSLKKLIGIKTDG